MVGFATVHYFKTLADTNKGSLTNRNACAKEHLKNDLKFEMQLAVPAAGALIAYKNPRSANAVASGVGNVAANFVRGLGHLIKNTKIGNKLINIANKIAKNPARAGKFGIFALVAAVISKIIAKYANKMGHINQKYEDAAKIESQTKNVVLDNSKPTNYAEMAL